MKRAQSYAMPLRNPLIPPPRYRPATGAVRYRTWRRTGQHHRFDGVDPCMPAGIKTPGRCWGMTARPLRNGNGRAGVETSAERSQHRLGLAEYVPNFAHVVTNGQLIAALSAHLPRRLLCRLSYTGRDSLHGSPPGG